MGLEHWLHSSWGLDSTIHLTYGNTAAVPHSPEEIIFSSAVFESSLVIDFISFRQLMILTHHSHPKSRCSHNVAYPTAILSRDQSGPGGSKQQSWVFICISIIDAKDCVQPFRPRDADTTVKSDPPDIWVLAEPKASSSYIVGIKSWPIHGPYQQPATCYGHCC